MIDDPHKLSLSPEILAHLQTIEHLRMRRLEDVAKKFGVPKERLIAAANDCCDLPEFFSIHVPGNLELTGLKK